VCRFHIAAGAKLRPVQGAIYKLFGAVANLASINLQKFGSFSYWFDKPWYHTEGRLAAVLITPSLGVSNWAVIYKTPTSTPHHHLSLALLVLVNLGLLVVVGDKPKSTLFIGGFLHNRHIV
jgi:hypothetical protein